MCFLHKSSEYMIKINRFDKNLTNLEASELKRVNSVNKYNPVGYKPKWVNSDTIQFNGKAYMEASEPKWGLTHLSS